MTVAWWRGNGRGRGVGREGVAGEGGGEGWVGRWPQLAPLPGNQPINQSIDQAIKAAGSTLVERSNSSHERANTTSKPHHRPHAHLLWFSVPRHQRFGRFVDRRLQIPAIERCVGWWLQLAARRLPWEVGWQGRWAGKGSGLAGEVGLAMRRLLRTVHTHTRTQICTCTRMCTCTGTCTRT